MGLEDKDNNGRTHEPSLRELTSDLDGLRDLVFSKINSLRDLFDERDKLYRERIDAQKEALLTALNANKEQTKASFDASEKAIVKAEDAQRAYNASHNDLIRKMEFMLPQSEARLKWDTIDKETGEIRRELTNNRELIQKEIQNLRSEFMKEVGSIRTFQSEGTGRSVGQHLVGTTVVSVIQVILSLLMIASIASVFLLKKP